LLSKKDMAFRIYTKTGDSGQTSLIGGTRVSKGSLRISAYGAVDTTNAYIGWVADLLKSEEVVSFFMNVQNHLFTIGSHLSVDPKKELKMTLPELHQEDILALEEKIDEFDVQLPPLRSFILPGGHEKVSACRIARCHCRDAERACVELADAGEELPDFVLPYLNRLSDLLFVLARMTARELRVDEMQWQPEK